jgi:hypothetical protein
MIDRPTVHGRPKGSRAWARSSGGPVVAASEEILGQFLGDESFPVQWASDTEKTFFWV